MANNAVVQSLLKENAQLKFKIERLEKQNLDMMDLYDRIHARLEQAQIGMEMIDIIKRAVAT